MRVIVCGGRHWTDQKVIREWLAEFKAALEIPVEEVTIVHGAARGADRIAGHWAQQLGFGVEPHPAIWYPLGPDGPLDRAAGRKRNRLMLGLGADRVVAFKANFNWNLDYGGSEDMIKVAKFAGVPFEVIEG